MMEHKCHDCKKPMELAKSQDVFGLDKKISTVRFYVCWKCKRTRIVVE